MRPSRCLINVWHSEILRKGLVIRKVYTNVFPGRHARVFLTKFPVFCLMMLEWRLYEWMAL